MKLIFLIISSIIFSLIRAQGTDRSVIIIGAGVSGYAAARRLMENGYTDITILESLDRIGGRIHSVPFSGGMVDLGAQWVHGEAGNSIYQMASSFPFGSTPIGRAHPFFVMSNGTTPRQENFQTLQSLAYSVLDRVHEIRNPRGSFGELYLTTFNQELTNSRYGHIDETSREFMRVEIHNDVNGDFGSSSWFDVSARLNWLQESTKGDQYLTWKREGFLTVFDFPTKKRPNPSQFLNIDSRVRFNKRVTNIRYSTNDPSSRSTVTCADGTSYTARHIIFTASVAVLKKHHQTMFTPALPTAKVRAINNIAMGNIGKFFMEFERPFWITPGVPFLQYSLLWSEAHKSQARATNRAYLIDVVAVYAVDQFPNVLEVFFSGAHTHDMEVATNDKVLSDIMWMLELFLPQLVPIPRPRAVLKTKWLTDENFLGSYTYPSMTQERNAARIADLASTIRAGTSPAVLFVGEATNSEYQAMAHGAVDSGTRAANEIISFHR